MLIFIINLRSSKNRKDLMTKKIENLAKKSQYEVFLESRLLNERNSSVDLCEQVGANSGNIGDTLESKVISGEGFVAVGGDTSVAHLESSVNATSLASNPSIDASPQSLESNIADTHLGVESSAFGTQILEVENAISSLESSDNFEGLESEPPYLPHSRECVKCNNLNGLESESSDLPSGDFGGCVMDMESGVKDLPIAFTNQSAESKIYDLPLESSHNSPLESHATHLPFESNALDLPPESHRDSHIESQMHDLPLESKSNQPLKSHHNQNPPLESNFNSPLKSNAHNSFSGVTGKHLKVDSLLESPRNLSLDSNSNNSPLESNALDTKATYSPIESKSQNSLTESQAYDSPRAGGQQSNPAIPIESPHNSLTESSPNLPLESKASVANPSSPATLQSPQNSLTDSQAYDSPRAGGQQSNHAIPIESKSHDSPIESNALDLPIDTKATHSPLESQAYDSPTESYHNQPLESHHNSPLAPKVQPGEQFYFHFFEAICEDTPKSDKSHIKRYSPFLTKLVRGRELSSGELYCFASHFALWQKCLDLGQNIVILEDDVSFCDGFLESILEIENSHFEYVRLCHTIDKKLHHLYENFYISYANISGTQGYFLSSDGARKFVKRASKWFHCVDNYMDMFFVNDVANIVYKPFCIYEDSILASDSTIKNRAKTKIGWGWKISREISRFVLFGIYKNLYLLCQRCKGKRYKERAK